MSSNELDEATLPVLFYHSKAVYDEMLNQSTKQSYKDGDIEKVAVVYEGFLTKLITEDLHLSVPYYSSVMGALKKMGCATQMRRGGSTSPSQWQLFTEPTEDLFRDKYLGGKKRRGPTSQYSTRLDQVEDNVARVMQLVNRHEAILQNIIQEEGQQANVLP